MAPQTPPRIRFAALTFDPLTERPIAPTIRPASAPAGAGPERVVVQFHRALTSDEQLKLKSEFGLTLRDYVPDHAYLERLTPATLARLLRDPLTRASVPYLAAFKVVPGIGEQEFTTEERRAVKGLWITCVLFRDADPEPVAESLRALGARDVIIVDDRRHGGAPKINLILDSAALLAAVAELPDIKVIEEMPEPSDDNAGAAGTNQSGVATTPSIWDARSARRGSDHRDDRSQSARHRALLLSGSRRQHARCRPPEGAADPQRRQPAAGRPQHVRRRMRGRRRFQQPGCARRTAAARGRRGWCPGTTAGRLRRQHDGRADRSGASMGATIHTNSWHDKNPAKATRRNTTSTPPTSTSSRGRTKTIWCSARPATPARNRALRAPRRTPSASAPPGRSERDDDRRRQSRSDRRRPPETRSHRASGAASPRPT